MISLTKTLNAWNAKDFTQTFKKEVADLDNHVLPLQQGLSLSSYVSQEKISALIHSTQETDTSVIIRSGIFYSGIIAGCSCSDDPTPTDTQNEYCEILFNINKNTGITTASLISD